MMVLWNILVTSDEWTYTPVIFGCQFQTFMCTIKIQIQMIKTILALLLISLASGQTGSIQLNPNTPTLWAQTSYLVSYYTFFTMPSASTFVLNFSSTYITIPSGTLNISTVLNNTPVTGAAASCSGSLCTIRLNRVVVGNTNIKITIGSFTNPYFLRAQPITASVTYNSTYTENLAYLIGPDQYSPMPITSNSLTQSDYGVGNTGVNYIFNFSVPMSPAHVQLSLTIPPQVSLETVQTSLVYYGAVQYAIPVFVGNIIVLTFTTNFTAATSPTGFILLNVSGLTNPQSMGQSSSFILQILVPTLPGSMTTCSNCAVAQLTSSLFAQSTVPGNIHTINMFSSNAVIGQPNNITIYSKLYASIPSGGIYQILLPSSIRPVLPVYCSSMYGFDISGSTASCSYNSTNNAIYTNNFALSGTGSVVITVSIINPPDTTQANFYFQSFDSAANMIGNSTTSYPIVATPLTLNVTAVKTNYQVESGYRMTVNCTLGVALTPSNKIQVVLPQAGYTTSGITCFAGTTVPCTTGVDPLSQNLTVSLTPPCSPCSAGTTFSFAIDGLTNPSFINSYSQAVIVQSATSTGIIETSLLSLSLSPSTLTISNYTRSGANTVGSTYSMSFTYTISNYINQNGGMLLINFNPLDTFVNPSLDTDGNYAYPSSITVTDSQSNKYTNSLTYNTTSNPNSLQQIAINICGGSNCAGSIIISGLRKGFNPLSSLTQNIQITTIWGDSVSTSTFNAIQFNVVRANRPLTLSLSNSVTTLASNYVIDFISASVPFQSGLIFSLSSLHTINGGCFLTHNASIFKGVFSCQVLNTTSVSLTYTGDTSLMMLQTIGYTLSIINVVNPISIVSLPYQLTTQFSSTTNSQWSTTYAIQTPLPLNFLVVKSNNTFGQAATINITIVSNYPSFNEIRMVAGSTLMTVMPSSSATTSYQTTMVNNAYQISQIYTIANQSVILNIINPNTTGISGNISLSMFNAGSLSATGTISIQNVIPMFLGLSTATTTRAVGDTANLTVNFLRVNSYSSESQFMLSLTSALYDVSGAQYNGVPVTFPIAIPIGLTSVTITNLRNLLYIPLASPSTGISAWTLDASNAIVATTSFSPSNLVPNTPATAVGSAFTRTNTVINGVGSININYTPRFPTATSIMTITLPQSQTTLVSPACSMQGASNLAATCSVLSSNTTTITLSYFNQTSTILTNVVNVEPNSNQLRVSMFTANNQLIETASGTITPTIQYNALTLTAISSSTTVATNNQLQFNITSPSPIEVGSRIVINVPTGSFTRLPALVSQDCNYSIGGASYTGCQYAYQGNWLTQVNLTAFGTTQLAANTVIVLTIYTTNAWSVVPFGTQSFTVLVSNPSDSFVAQGSISLVTVFGGIPSLNAAAVTNATFSQVSTTSNAVNSLTITYSLGIALPSGSLLNVYLPKSAYSLISSSSTISNLQSSTENTTYYALTVRLTCNQAAPLCNLPNSQYSLTIPLQNNPYSQIQNNPIAFQIMLASNQVTTQSSVPLQSFTAQTLTSASASISRSNLNAFANTNVTIIVPNPNTVTSFTLLVSPLVKSTGTLPLMLAPTYAGIGSSSFSFQLNTTNFLNVSVTGATGPTSRIVLSGQNNLLVSSIQAYTITIVDSNFVYFTGQVTTSDTLLPYTSGLSLQRTVTTVDTSTNLYLHGTLPTNLPSLSVSFNGVSYSVPGGTFNISLGTMTNSNNISDSSTYPIVIRNTDFTAFSTSLPISPSLTPQTFTALTSITLPSVVNVSSIFNITASLNSPSLTYLSIRTGSYFKSLTKCCIDAACTQTSIKSCTLAQNGGNFIELWLTAPQTLTSIIFQVVALDYQSTFTNQTLSVTSALPTAFTTTTSNLTITAANIFSSLAVLNWKVNSLNTYTVSIQPIAKAGYMQITLPSFISTQLAAGNGNAAFTLTINGTIISANMQNQVQVSTLTFPVTPSSSNIVLLMTSITNPADNSPNSIIVTQAEDQSLTNVYGYTRLGFAMKQFDQITLVSAIRVVTKVNVATNLILQAVVPYASSQFVISFPSSQLITTSTCSIVANQTQALPCQVINSSAILTSSLAGTSRYTITGLQNQKFYNVNSTQDLISAQIGTPYTKATTLPASSTFITPHLTLGSIVVNSMTSSSNFMLAKTTLTYNITIENTNNINGFLLVFANYHYIFSPTLTCYINNEKITCTPIDNHTLFMSYASPQGNNLIVTVSNIVNFIQPSDWTFKSVQTYATNGVSTYSDVDLYYNDGQSLSPFQSSTLVMRVILPFNYVHSSPVTFQAIIDSEYSSFLPLSSFALNFTTQTNGCQLFSSSFASTLTISCSFPESTNYKMKLQLYHNKFPSTALSVGTSNVFIYPSPGGGCSNQMCDSCSYANGQEYCFSCREGLYSSNGQCSSSCSTGSFPYSDTNICQPCSPTCSNCFGLYSSQCLSCSDTSKTLSSGECVDSCPPFTYAYNAFCVSSEECSGAEGCRLCSNTGFCYQCLPDYAGAPTCKYVNVMPPTIMVYFIAPLAGLALVSIIIAAAKCVGADSLLSQSIFSFSMVELFAWVFTVPIMPNITTAMALVAFLTLRIIISIVSYEVFYKKNMGELSQKLLEEQSQKEIEGASSDKKEEQDSGSNLNNWKTKLVRLTAHFNGPDSYQLLKCRIAEPVLAVSSSLAIDVIFMLNRWVVCVLMFYMASIGTIGDSVLMPIFVIANAGLLTVFRLLGWDKVRKCLSACRS